MFYLTPITALALSLILFPALRILAIKARLVDKPNARKVHANPTPLIGGMGVFLSTAIVMFGLSVWGLKTQSLSVLIWGSSIMLLMGIVDDKVDLRASLKLGIQLLLAHLAFSQGVRLETLGGFLGIYELTYMASYFLTIVIIAGVVNAFNLMDGIDGLAAALALVSVIVYSFLAVLTNNIELLLLFLAIGGALPGFLYFNFSKERKIFMGDAGSLVLGFVLVVSGLMLMMSAQGTTLTKPVSIGVAAVLLAPVMDALRVFRKRIKAGNSPFKADKTHIHHLVLRLGISHKRASMLISFMVIVLFFLAILSNSVLGITLTISGLLIAFFVITSVLEFNNKIQNWKERIWKMEEAND